MKMLKIRHLITKCKIDSHFFNNNTHTKISASSLAESTSINPKQCRKLKLSAKRWNWVQKVEIKLIDRKVAKARQTKWRPLSEGLERAKTAINAKFDRFNENQQCINQCTSNWTFVQHKRGSTKLLKATNRGFSFATARKEGRLQAWIEVAHFSSFLCNWMRIKAPDNAWKGALKFRGSIWIYKAWQLLNVLTPIRKGKRPNTSCLSSTCREIFVCVLLTSNHMIFLVQFGINQHS